MHPYNRIDMTAASKRLHFILSDKFDFHMIDKQLIGGARGVMVIVVGNGYGDMSSNPGQDWLHFT